MTGKSLGAPGIQESFAVSPLQSVTRKLLGGSGTPSLKGNLNS